MSKITENELKEKLKKQVLNNLYFLYGEEKYTLGHYTKKIISSAVGNNPSKFNLRILNGEDLSFNKFYNSLESLPLFSEKKCIVINDFSFDNFSKTEISKIKKTIQEISKDTFLVISQKNNFEKKLTTKQLGLVSFFEKNAIVVEFKRLTEKFLIKQLIFWAKSLKTELSSDNALLMIKLCGNNLEILKNELSKLCALSEYKIITEKMINNFICKNIENTVFHLSNEIAIKNYKKAFEILDNLFVNKYEPTLILAIISNFFIDLYRVKIGKKIGKNLEDLSEIFDYSKNKIFRLKTVMKYCENFNENDISDCIKILIYTDFLLKNSPVNKKTIMQEMIAKMAKVLSNDKKR